ncbi:hypothetical protein ACQKQA_15175 [Pseudomonas sp. NPDC089530]|uniref:hypothetical protein n=1 Tax=Pseudomonas sp. NPDC089530 TaxID=3390651 RepID=UPI003D01E9DD
MKPSPPFSPVPSSVIKADSERFRHALQQFWLSQPCAADAGQRNTPATADQPDTHRPRASTQAL